MGPDRAILDELTQAALQSLAGREPPAPSVLRLLLRTYLSTGRNDIGDALGPALAEGLALAGLADNLDDQVRWLNVFVDAAALSEDDRLLTAADDLIAAQQRLWEAQRANQPASLMRSLEACLRAVRDRASGQASGGIAQAAIDELERVVGRLYSPGQGMSAGSLADQIAAGLALSLAYTVSGRLPYAMLAEELLQFARRTSWHESVSLFRDEPPVAFLVNCEAARLLSSLADLHADDDYKRSAITAADADYQRDAERLLAALIPKIVSEDLEAAAAFGVVLHDFLARELR